LGLNGKLQRIADQEKALLERMKQNRSEMYKNLPSTSSKAPVKRPLVELNSSKDDISSEDELPINLEMQAGTVNKYQKKRQKKQLKLLADQIESIGLDKSNSSLLNEEVPVHVDTPVRKTKSSKKKIILTEICEAEEEEGAAEITKKKKGKKAKKRVLTLSDDETMEEKPEPAAEEPRNPKRAKLEDDPKEMSDEDVIDKINETHHQKLNQRGARSSALESTILDNSVKKTKKKKNKPVSKNLTDDSWNVQSRKKLEKYEKKKLKYQVKQQKLMEKEARAENKSKKKRKKEAKKKLETITNVFDSVEL
jgi:hypothetical protein